MDDDFSKAVKSISDGFVSRGLKLSVAESCTGGLIAAALTDMPGASRFFEMGVVCYSIGSKKSVLGVPSSIINKYGVISRETALAMATAVIDLSGSDFSVSTTGVAGPDRAEGKEAGLVYIAAASKGMAEAMEISCEGDRDAVRRRAALEALRFLHSCLDKWL